MICGGPDPGGVGHGEGDGPRRRLRAAADVGAVQRGHRALPDAAAAALLPAAGRAPLPRQESVAHRVSGMRQVTDRDTKPKILLCF